MKFLSYLLVLLIVKITKNEAFLPSHGPVCWTQTARCRNVFHTTALTYSLPVKSTRRFATSGAELTSASKCSPTEVPTGVEILCRDPLVYVIPDLLSPLECDDFRRYVEDLKLRNRTMTRSNPPEVSLQIKKLWPLPFLSVLAGVPQLLKVEHGASIYEVISKVMPTIIIAFGITMAMVLLAVPLLRSLSNSSSRTSEAMALNLEDDTDFVRQLVTRIEGYTDHSWDRWEAPVVTRYDPGAIFARHGDASPNRGSEWEGLGGQRVVTCICYLNDIQVGGETYFDKLGLAVSPKQGKALVFFPAHRQSLDADDRTTHESLPPEEEEKWIVQMFGRVQPVPSPLGLPDSFG